MVVVMVKLSGKAAKAAAKANGRRGDAAWRPEGMIQAVEAAR